jgi:hypothetical protein
MGASPTRIPETASPGRRRWLAIELLGAVGLTLALGLLALGFVLESVGAYPRQGSSRAGQIVGAVVFLGLAVLCSRWALHVEHRLRRGDHVARAFESTHMSGARRVRLPPGVGRRRGYGPVGTSVILAFFGLATLAFIGIAIEARAEGSRSSFVQHHGVRDTATVIAVDNTEHCSRGGCSYTAAITATLSSPVAGAPVTVVHYRGFSNLVQGQPIIVLVDPKQPSYAELPGARFETSWAWIVGAVLALVFAWLTWTEARVLRRLLAHRSTVRTHGVTRPASAGL